MEQRCPYKTEVYSHLTKKEENTGQSVISQILIKIGLVLQVLSNFLYICQFLSMLIKSVLVLSFVINEKSMLFFTSYTLKLIFQLATISVHYAMVRTNFTFKSTCRSTHAHYFYILKSIFVTSLRTHVTYLS